MRPTPEAFAALPLTEGGLHRRAELRDDPGLLSFLLSDPDTKVVEVRDGRCRISAQDGRPALAVRAPQPGDVERLVCYLGVDDDADEWVAVSDAQARVGGTDAAATTLPPRPGDDGDEGAWTGLRECGSRLEPRDATVFATALALHNWHAAHQHCPRCGSATRPAKAGWVRVCTVDGSEHYPRTDPAVIMSVIDADERLLIARGATWPQGRFSVLAGFVEPGETIAQAVAREVKEESGVDVTDIEFVADQPWPFPSSLMIGCTARATSTELALDDGELAEARWISREEVPQLVAEGRWQPLGRMSVASRLVEQWYGGRLPRGPRPA